MNKIGIYYAFWEKNWFADFAFYANKVSKLSFDVLELPAVSLLEMSEKELDRLNRIREETGIEYTFSMGLPKEYDLSSKEDEIRTSGVCYIKNILKKISQLGGKIFGGLTYGAWNAPIEDSKEGHWERAITSLKQIMPIAEDYGIFYCIEVVNRFEQFILNDHKEAIEFLKAVESPNLKIELDTFHMNIEEDCIYDAIINTNELLGHFHIGENNRKPPGTGSMDWGLIFKALKKINYSGRIVMEPFVLKGGEVGRDIGIWREIMPNVDLDNEAKKALEFVRGKLISN